MRQLVYTMFHLYHVSYISCYISRFVSLVVKKKFAQPSKSFKILKTWLQSQKKSQLTIPLDKKRCGLFLLYVQVEVYQNILNLRCWSALILYKAS